MDKPLIKYHNFERLLKFIDTDNELDSVLSGYFCDVFKMLISHRAKEVFEIIVDH